MNMTLRTMIFTELKKDTVENIKIEMELGNIDFLTQQETFEKDSLYISSGVWIDFRRMLVREANVLIENLAWCTHCKQMVKYFGSTTTRLLEHQNKCAKRPFVESDAPAKINFKLNELADVHNSGAQYIVKDCQAYFAIKGEGLLDLCYASVKLGWKYPKMTRADLANAFPSPNTIKSRVSQMALDGTNLLTRKIHNSIKNTKRIAATCDMWTEPLNSTSTLALTLHFFTIEESTIILEAHTVDLREINAPSVTGSIIKQAILDIFLEYGVIEEAVEENVCIVTDRGSNMLVAVSSFESEVCLAHLLNNVVGQMIKLPEVKDIVTKASALVRYMKKSHAGSQMNSKLKSFPDTRFNYALDMLKSIHDNHTEVYNILRDKEESSRNSQDLTEKITCLPVNKLKEMCDFLIFFKNATTAIEGTDWILLLKII